MEMQSISLQTHNSIYLYTPAPLCTFITRTCRPAQCLPLGFDSVYPFAYLICSALYMQIQSSTALGDSIGVAACLVGRCDF